MSSGRPIRRSGAASAIASPNDRSVAAIILDSNGPGATALTVTCLGPSSLASTLVRWCSPALLAEYAYVCMGGPRQPQALGLGRQVRLDRRCLPVPGDFPLGVRASQRVARADVNPAGAGLEQAAGDHQPDAAGAAGHDGRLAGQVEQVHRLPPRMV